MLAKELSTPQIPMLAAAAGKWEGKVTTVAETKNWRCNTTEDAALDWLLLVHLECVMLDSTPCLSNESLHQ